MHAVDLRGVFIGESLEGLRLGPGCLPAWLAGRPQLGPARAGTFARPSPCVIEAVSATLQGLRNRFRLWAESVPGAVGAFLSRADEVGLRSAACRAGGRAEALVAASPKSQAVPSDEALLVAYREGDRTAFERIIERYRAELLNFLTRFLNGRAAAEDVFQETFLQIHLSADQFDASRSFKPWLFTIAANKARDHHRRQKRRAAASLSTPIGHSDDGGTLVDLLEGDAETPDAPVERSEDAGRIREVVDAMPSHYREILLLSYFHRMSYQQISETLEVPLGTVKSRLHSAVATFAEQWRIATAPHRGGDPAPE